MVRHRKGVRWVTTQETGLEKKMRVHKVPPKKCSTPRQICILCKSERIHKNSKRYESKICEKCSEVP